ncbi:MAG: hypothetical protein Q4C47_05590 [Planctomycetia bacterium]|nr:hypothetical protein [Planctomycetia bacterium]
MKRFLTLLIVLRLLILVIVAFQGGFRTDPDAYRALAENLCDEYVFGNGDIPTAYRPPLYPILLTPAVLAERITGLPWMFDVIVVLFHGFLVVATITGSWRLADRLCVPATVRGVSELMVGNGSVRGTFSDSTIRWRLWIPPIAATLVALDPVLIRQSGLLMTETLATCLAVWLLIAGNPVVAGPRRFRRSLGVGGAYGLAALCRPAFLPVAGVAALYFAWTGRKDRTGKIASVCFLGATLLPLLIWGGRNLRELHRPILTTTHGGYTLLLGNQADFYAWVRGDQRRPWDAASLQRELAVEFPFTGGIPLGMPDISGFRTADMDTRAPGTHTPDTSEIPDISGSPDTSIASGPSEIFDGAPDTSERPDTEGTSDGAILTGPAVRRISVVSELEMDARLRERAIIAIREDPTGFLRASAYRLRRFFGVVPYGTEPESVVRCMARWGVVVYFVFCAVRGGVGVVGGIRCRVWTGDVDRWILCVTMVLTTVAIHSVYWTDIRMRSVIVPILAVVAAGGLVGLVSRRRWWRESP